MSDWVTQSFRLRLGSKKPSHKQVLALVAQWNYPYCGLVLFMQQWWLSLSHQPGFDILFCVRNDWPQERVFGWILADLKPARLVVWHGDRLAAIEQGEAESLIKRVCAWQAEYPESQCPNYWYWCSCQPAPDDWPGLVMQDKQCSESFVRLAPAERLAKRASSLVKWTVSFIAIVVLAALVGFITLFDSPQNDTSQTEPKVIKQLDHVLVIDKLGQLMSRPFFEQQQLVQIEVARSGIRLTWQQTTISNTSPRSARRHEILTAPLKAYQASQNSQRLSINDLLDDYRQQFYDAQIVTKGATQWQLTYDMMSYRHLQQLAAWLARHPELKLSSLSMRYQHGYWSVQWTLDYPLVQPI